MNWTTLQQPGSSCRRDRFGQALLQAVEQRLALVLRDVVGEAGVATRLDVARIGVVRLTCCRRLTRPRTPKVSC
jgi:hypothetical protein